MTQSSLEAALLDRALARADADAVAPSDSLRDRIWRALQRTGWTTTQPTRTLPQPTADSDEVLLARICRGDAAAFALLMDRHMPALLGYARRSLSDAEAEEAVQETMLVLSRKADQVKPENAGVRRFLFGVLKIEIKRVLTYNSRVKYANDDEIEQHEDKSHEDIEQKLAHMQDIARLAEGVDEVCDVLEQDILALVREGCATAAIASRLELTEGCVRTRKHRAIKKLRAYFDGAPS